MNRTSIELADGSGDYWASLDVVHNLHCLVRENPLLDFFALQVLNLRLRKSFGTGWLPTTIARKSQLMKNSKKVKSFPHTLVPPLQRLEFYTKS